MPFAFTFVNTPNDLADAFDADRTARTGMRKLIRAGVGGLGLMWLLGAIFALFATPPMEDWWLGAVWLVLGLSITWRFIANPLIAKRRLLAAAPQAQVVDLAIDETGIVTAVKPGGQGTHRWGSLKTVVRNPRGIALAYVDGFTHWIPQRAFKDSGERSALEAFVATHSPRSGPKGTA